MVLNHVPKRPCSFLITSPVLSPELFARRDLHVVDIARVPQMLENGVSETQNHDVLCGFFSEIVIHPERVRFGETVPDRRVQCFGALSIDSEWLLHEYFGPP